VSGFEGSRPTLIAAIGVIFSLIFVGLQINEGNLETRAATNQATADAEAFMIATFANHSDTWNKVITGVPIVSEAELRKGTILYNLLMVHTENQYRQFESGFLDARSWAGHKSNIQPLVQLPIYKTWRQSLGAKGHSADFLEILDSLVEERPVE